ncbi:MULTISPECIES: SRPBCC family protein [unclassified Nocardioides]|uniref:SRPBCC family protein n=1 Tax=unclassified Nocardioides TaxID=2615069 RepID=UPI0006FD956F|nr:MULTISPECIES: SRPBCC family protein [unclassified Nocardioides]KQY57415.1 polyketide cyclase [Nocardioides sp. Root140]KQZ68928.1 polyketide cyclase [Nocardioides sp. Root151]KRF20394.1 polyketide cyclase [Nocardioides sp. Soil796]
MTEVLELLEESIDIDADPATVWALVTDMPRMAQWSPQVVKTIVRGDGIALGTRTVNINRRGLLVWPTRSKVIRFEPEREFAFRIKDNKSVWSFSLDPIANGTRVVQRRQVPNGTTKISDTLIKAVMGGQESFQLELRGGMRQTLKRIKADAEGTG